MVLLLYLNIFWCSLAAFCVSINYTAGIPSRDKRNFQEDLNDFEIAIQNLLGHHGSSKKGHSTRTKIVDTSLEGTSLDEQAHRDRKLEGRLAGSRLEIPEAIDMAFQPQKQRFEKQKGNRKFLPELEGESKGRKETQKMHETPGHLDTLGDEDHEDETENIYLTGKKMKNNAVEDGKNKTKNSKTGKKKIQNNVVKDGGDETKKNKKDFSVLVHEVSRKNSTTLHDLSIPDAVDLAFTNGPRKSNLTRSATTAKPIPTTIYWPPTTASSPTQNQICRSKIDLGFLVEASKSVARTGPANYRRLMNFVKHVVVKFAIGPTATRIGVISYANRPILLMGFNDGENIPDVLKFLNLPCHQCWNAQTGLALSFAESLLFGCSCSLRQRVLVVVTDGSASDGVHIPSTILKQKGVKILAVGVGRYFNIDQLNVMASRPAQQNVFTGDFSRIHHVTNELVRQICNIARGSMAPSSSSPCKCP